MANPLFIAIGVHNAATMPVLDGVLTSIDDLSTWAESHGYDVVKFDDRTEPLTVDIIKDRLTPRSEQYPGGRNTTELLDRPRIVVYFCGHGLDVAQDQYWILSAGPDQPGERITAVGFREMLASYGPRQVAIFSDACRTPASLDGLASSVINKNQALPGKVEREYFYSSRPGESSFAVPAKDGKPAYCVFSNVLLRALSAPPDPDALDTLYLMVDREIVSSQSLADYLETKVPVAALEVDRFQAPQCNPGFRPLLNVYVEFARAHGLSPRVIALGADRRFTERSAAQQDRIARSVSEWRRPYSEHLQTYMGPQLETSLRKYKRGPLFYSSNSPNPDVDIVVKEPPDQRIGVLPDVIGVPYYPIRQNWTATPIHGFVDTSLSSVCVVRAADFYTVVPIHRRLWCGVILDVPTEVIPTASGAELMVWGDVYPIYQVGQKLSSAEALKGLSSRTLNAQDTAVLAQEMRYAKHADPMYGIVSAYLYNSIGDVSNIRRMCYYYKSNGQDAPFDVAMLAGVELEQDHDGTGQFFVNVPEVPELPAIEQLAEAPDFVWRTTPATRVGVAGVTPLLRVGWQYIQASQYAVHRKCWELASNLTASPIATLRGHDAGTRMIEILREI